MTFPPSPHLDQKQHRIAIFASGAGTNAAKIIAYFKDHAFIQPSLIVCNKEGAGVLSVADHYNIPALLIKKDRFFTGDAYLLELEAAGIDFIVLAGFLWKVPTALITAYEGRIINIHPALLPRYGGKGMYGANVHKAVIENREAKSGITIHYVNDHYDEGAIIFQAECPVQPNDTADTLAQRIHALEHQYYPQVIEETIQNLDKSY